MLECFQVRTLLEPYYLGFSIPQSVFLMGVVLVVVTYHGGRQASKSRSPSAVRVEA